MKSAPRMALQYVLLFGASGVTLPFAGLWFRSQGLSGAEIGALLAIPMLGRVVTGPLLAVWADGFKYRRTPIALLGLAMALGYGGAGLVHGFVAWAVCWFVGATAAAALIPLSDVMTLRVAKRDGFPFSLPRGCGSAAFVVANVAMGALLTRVSPDAVVVWIGTAALLIAVTAWRVLPAEPVTEGPRVPGLERFKGLGRLVVDPVFMTAIFAVGAVQAAHAFYYGFSAIAWKAQGIPESMTGLLWAFSVVVEIGFMWVVEPWRRRAGIGPWLMLLVGAGAAVLRWTLMAFAPPLWALWPLQTLHALSFAATYLAGVQIVERLSPPDNHTAAQTLSSVVSAGVLIGLATAASGPLYDAFGLKGYLAMAGLAFTGGLVGLVLQSRLSKAQA
ncbi:MULTISPECIES: MFS transporter [unclassified Brevundimonas]|uniref:MFS transporter n=1 Tax=unclassified Brevundimonas TaxID=2622653 RepID=UPI000CFD0489|nr:MULTISPECIES: MFS transporter [unclassified Brevundimonas]PRA30942.1 MFS transporter [Brevundimonas sp. MYb27]PQZ82800.1 MFS transporter [Brevundimonas sp. MYb31]PRB16805.1 MFS transporter [Brevundimonas sp. MYb52]PRB34659.1 MFS transporter [Brevundimonas sp. MYb46]PRB54776.1 MFS transporter [Brevundimonas sp. MYb33]